MIDQEVSSNDSGEWPASLDAMTAAPEYHRVLLENDQVRVLDTSIGPGQSTPVHTHASPGIYYVLSWSDFIRYDADGNVILDSRTLAAKPNTGAALWAAPLGPHSARNVGTEDLHVIAVELKGARSGTPQ